VNRCGVSPTPSEPRQRTDWLVGKRRERPGLLSVRLCRWTNRQVCALNAALSLEICDGTFDLSKRLFPARVKLPSARWKCHVRSSSSARAVQKSLRWSLFTALNTLSISLLRIPLREGRSLVRTGTSFSGWLTIATQSNGSSP
jgi:hypothetical protein